MQPLNAITAASHHDPYSYYHGLLAEAPLVFDTALGMWIASHAAVIEKVMANLHCLARPLAEPVPRAIADTSAGAVFARLVRMNEGTAHAVPKLVIAQALAALDSHAVAERSTELAAALGVYHGPADGAAITRWMFDVPTYVVADLLGFGADDLPQVALWMSHFVRCLSPLATNEQLAGASRAAHALQARFSRMPASALAADIYTRAAQAGWTDEEAIVANLIGLLSQTHEATAGLIGNSIVALLREPGMHERLRSEPALTGAFVEEVARHDPSVQNTRRFVAQSTIVAGVTLQKGDVILLLLAAASRDQQADDHAGVFSLERTARKLPGFGHGRHACPGKALAMTIAASAVRQLLAAPLPDLGWTYAPSANGRLPRFFCKTY